MENIKKKILKELNTKYNKDILEMSDFSYPPNKEMGDLSMPCFKLSKELGKTPVELSQELVKDLGDKFEEIQSLVAMGPYLNFFLNKSMLFKEIFKDVSKKTEGFGTNKSGKKKRVMIEFSNVNTHKEYHVGHLRNISFGDSVSRILSANGYDVLPVSYINDFGIHTAKTLWAYNEFYKRTLVPSNKGAFLGEIYVRASKELENNEVGKQTAAFIMKKIESREGPEYELWKKTREWSIKQFDAIYKELGVKIDHVFYENEFIDEGIKQVTEMLKKGILKESDGAIIADLEEYNLGVMVFMRSDGTALYPVADIPLAKYKIEKYKLNESIYVVDNRQKLHFKQLFKVIELMGYKQKLVHLDHDFVTLPDGAMSSRSGNTVTYEQLKEEAFKKSFDETKKRHEDWPEYKVKEVAEKIIFGAMKFEMLKVGSDQVITFDTDQALRFDGYTAAYLQYTYARIASILRKAGDFDKKSIDFSELKEDKENILVIKIAKYSEVVKKAAEDYNPSEIAKYLFDLAQSLNDYYHSVKILKSGEEEKKARLALVFSVQNIIKNGLNLLGIDTMEEM
ncbi:arginine--tRNA ligase [Candidatus Parcubacteria bacterium]|nr:MAG: arginine--tRNA ligase [Candidatus Parcubacteria bacterium]